MKETRYLISETAKLVQVEPHVLRYWEEELGLSIKRNEMGHRYYTDKDLEIFQKIKELKKEGLQLKTIKEKLHEKDEIPQVEEHRISGEGIIKLQRIKDFASHGQMCGSEASAHLLDLRQIINF